MINANELRLGNWIMVAGTGELHPVKVNIDNLRSIAIHNGPAAGIELTPEILKKAGFAEGHIMIWDAGIKLNFWDGKAFIGNLTSTNATIVKDITYLHQLQNLFFALTGTEIDIKL